MKNIIFIITLIFIQFTFAIAPPTGSTNQYFCNSNFWILADLTVNSSTGQVFLFGENDNSGVQLSVNTVLTNGITYFAFESTNSGELSLAITAHLLNEIPAPESGFVDPFPCNLEELTIADLTAFNTEGFQTIYWFTEDDNSGTILPNETPLIGDLTYYAFQGLGDCALSLPIYVSLEEKVPAPEGQSMQYFCEGETVTLADLAVFNTSGFSSILWFNDENQSIALSPSAIIENETTYYAFQGIGGQCILGLNVTTFILDLISAPLGEAIYCVENNSTLNELEIFNTDSFTNIYFYLSVIDIAIGQTINPFSTIVSGTTYYASQVNSECATLLAFTVFDISECPNASVHENELESFLMYPNPTKDILTITIPNLTSNFEIVITDFQGRKVYNNNFSLKDNIITIPISNLEANVYFVSLINRKQVKTEKFIKYN